MHYSGVDRITLSLTSQGRKAGARWTSVRGWKPRSFKAFYEMGRGYPLLGTGYSPTDSRPLGGKPIQYPIWLPSPAAAFLPAATLRGSWPGGARASVASSNPGRRCRCTSMAQPIIFSVIWLICCNSILTTPTSRSPSLVADELARNKIMAPHLVSSNSYLRASVSLWLTHKASRRYRTAPCAPTAPLGRG
jgi:hypothetical protein